MLRKTLLALLVMASAASLASLADASPQTDTDWNWSGEPNCEHPRSDSAQWMLQGERQFVRFQLRDGDIGGCPTDNDATHSDAFDKPYSERAEWTGDAFTERDATYHISFDVRFVQGFEQDQLSATFLQIKDCPNSRVPVQVKLGGWKKATGGRAKMAFSLGPQSDGGEYFSQFLSRDPVDNRWHRIDAFFSTGNTHSFELQLDGSTILPRTEFPDFFECGRPRLHIGIYRSGDLAGNAHSIVDYDNLQIIQINE